LRNVLILGVLFLVACLEDNAGTNPPTGPGSDSLTLQLVAQGLSSPVFLTAAPADTSRLFVVEQGGRVRIIRNGVLSTEIFLDVRTRVQAGGEEGLLSIAFHPSYAQNGYVFAYYTNTGGDIRVVRFRLSPDPDSLDPASGDTILAVPHPVFANHNGGQINFGPDGFLYAGLGDGGGGGDPDNNGQDLGARLGKLLRVDVNGALPYTIPPGNPFVGTSGALPEIWAYGLRNPWRFSFDRSTGDLYIGDVGQNAREEVDFQPAASSGGENYGWDIMEGRQCSGGGSCDQTGLVLPVIDYPNPGEGCSVTGGYVYRGSRLPTYRGTYFYSDYCEGWIRSFRIAGGQVTEHRDWSGQLVTGGNVSSFGEDSRGELYVVTHNGRVLRVVSNP
jgi:glucose/arabinose dehydrogenase